MIKTIAAIFIFISSVSQAQICELLFVQDRLSETELNQAILELHGLRLEIFTSNKDNAQLALDLFNVKLQELSQSLPTDKIEAILTNMAREEKINLNFTVLPVNNRSQEIVLKSNLEIFLKTHRFKGKQAKNKKGEYPIHMAIKQGRSDIVEALIIEGVNLEKPSTKGITPLMQAAMEGNEKILELLLAQGVDLNRTDKDGNTALVWSLRHEHSETAEILMRRGADIEIEGLFKQNALMYASENNLFKIIELLLEQDTNVNKKNEYGWTALMIASETDCPESVRVLLGAGADFTLKNINSDSALSVAKKQNHKAVIKLLELAGAKK